MTMEPMELEPYTPSRIVGGIPHLSEYLTLADRISKTAMVPSGLRNKPDEILAVVLYGAELGIGPMQALQQINFISGKPSASAELLRALVMGQGHQFILAANDTVATARCKRKDWAEWQETSFTWDDAVQARITSGDNWKKYPRAMLSARVTSEACRMFFPDVISGMSYTPEEIESFAPVEIVNVTPIRPEPVEERSAPRIVDDAETNRVDEFLNNLTDDERSRVAEAWKLTDIPPLKHGLTTDEAQSAQTLIFEILDQPVVIDAEIVPKPENDEIEPSEATTDRFALRDGEEPFAQSPLATPKLMGQIRTALKSKGFAGPTVTQEAGRIIGREIAKLDELTVGEATRIIDQLRD